MVKFNYTDPKSGKAKTEYKRGFASKREAKKYEEDFIENLITPEETEIEPIRTFGEVFQEYLMSHKRADIKESTLETKFNIFNNVKASCKVHRAVYDRLTEVLEQLKRLNNGNEIDDELLENIKLITNFIEGLYQKK